jgi:hypothetical protein
LTVVHVYSVAMKTLYVMVRGNEKPVNLLSDKVEENEESVQLVAYRSGQVIGRFRLDAIAGWWLSD